MAASSSKADPEDRYAAREMIRRLLVEHAAGHVRLYAIAFALMLVVAACTALSAYLLGDVINQAYVHRNFTGIVWLGIATVVIFTVKGAATYGQAVMLARIGTRIIAENQRRMFDKLLNEGLSFFADRHSSEFIARLTTGANAATYTINLLITAVGRDFFSLVGLVAVMVVQDPMMSLVGLLVAPPAMLVLRKLIRRIRAIATMQFTGGTRIIETMQETLQGIRIVKAFTLEDEMRRRLDRSVQELERESVKMARVANRSSPLMETLGGIAISVAIIYSGYRVIETGATPGEFFSFVAAFLLAYEPAKRLARLNLDLHSNLVGVRVLFEIIDSPATEPIDDGKPPLVLSHARVAFDDVCFSYRPDEPVLRSMSFVAEPSKVTALVGPSGGGKSTILNLILRFYDIQSGTISIDGQDIASVSRHSLRQQIAYVGQNVHLFRGSIRENIAFGKPGASEAEIVAAAKAAHAHDFIMGFPLGYDAPVGEHGLQLSGGQRQRIAIACALIKNAPIILLDEATAALDSESERHVQEAIAELCKGRTTIIIAHRLQTVMHADRILVIENGTVVEAGRHDELLRRGGRYASFYRLQFENQGSVPALAVAR
ncbi:MAG TPA: ABC transporter ATP-binding protein [Xanthobacteraceae bacterium]|jgi:ATP-binding cassette subfamily B protein|nr:ABC transporter ATP-binding protein [Xanthobacteraceae bacterium]